MTKNKVKKEAKDKQENEVPELTVVQEEPAETEKEILKDTAEEKLGKAELELVELKDKHIRLQAEFDNYRKRTLKERMELLKTANESLLGSILPVIDDFDRAIQTLDLVEEESHIKDGVFLIYTKFQEFLKQNGIKEIEAQEQKFDTDLHEAITKISAPSKELKGKIVDVVQKGYYLNDKVIRFSKVVIGE
ncbi:MAG TPA: nucleotide exchange factor GrpE [Prolixibacteraceae bacterium]|nr:nucleotide exchange factor GrpE [Prolixibacteraceae bacterium]